MNKISIKPDDQVFVLTGAGISAESGLPTFRASDGLWAGNRVEDVCTPEAWQRNPWRVWEFYAARRAAGSLAQPNPAHVALAELEAKLGSRFFLCTQNVDDLHERAGSRRLLHMHGELSKNNHISLGGGLPAVLTRALERRRKGQRVQVEVRTAQELEDALAYGAEAILLDNMTVKEVQNAIERIRKETEGQTERWIPTEASGGIALENIRAYAETGVDFISVGALTHSAKAADISMTIAAE